ncbi:ribosome production factor 1 isoform X1 [Hydra vulgaris]|uniref:Ribosome production factor 1 n=1 Tax=Hydra vulgaris TaxID=6087 RepID=T2M4Q1_HYDVU|nr:ribosome production factor 1 [Hydra vulgaris]
MSDISEKKNFKLIKNKILRNETYRKEKKEKDKEKRKLREKRKRERDALGEKAPPKKMQKTLDNMRVKDETFVDIEDEEILQDTMTDEMASYFKGEQVPKVLFTTCNRPKCHETLNFIEDLVKIVPNSEYRNRKGIDLKKIIPQAVERGFTDLVIINEDQKKANGLIISHLPNGPTAHFKLSSVRKIRDIKNHGKTSQHRPELILNNFNTRLGHSVARLLAALFPYDPQFQGRRAVTFHNQRDFIFFRHHRYVFKNGKKTGLQELGPRFTLKLRSLQKGSFDSKYGEYEWIHKRKDMDTSRRKFHL